MTTKPEQFLYAGYTYHQEQHFKELREQIRANLQKDYEEMMKR
jgi:hypothetical protein